MEPVLGLFIVKDFCRLTGASQRPVVHLSYLDLMMILPFSFPGHHKEIAGAPDILDPGYQ
jgi:hypothetical protein